jgi:hypothetical protein
LDIKEVEEMVGVLRDQVKVNGKTRWFCFVEKTSAGAPFLFAAKEEFIVVKRLREARKGSTGVWTKGQVSQGGDGIVFESLVKKGTKKLRKFVNIEFPKLDGWKVIAGVLRAAQIVGEESEADEEEESGVSTGTADTSDSPDTTTGKPSAADSLKAIATASNDWRDAMGVINGQLKALQSELKKIQDDEFKEIAEFGLNGITANHRVPVQAILMEFRGAKPSDVPALAKKGLPLVEAFADHIASSEQVEVVDDNKAMFAELDPPMPGVEVTIRDTLGPALNKLADAMRAAAQA